MISREDLHEGIQIVTVTDVGIGHRLSGIPNQDAVEYSFMEGDFVLAVSDGVGACSEAALGARMAVKAAQKSFCALKEDKIEFEKDEIIDFILKEWFASLKGIDVNNCCATLKIAIKQSRRVILISIGDGMLMMTSAGINAIAPMDDSLFINQTVCLNSKVKNSDFWATEVQLDTYLPYAILMCTDGVANNIQVGSELILIKEIEANIDTENLKDELELLVIDIADYTADDRTIGVVKYEGKNAKSHR